jgi:hypothetical protein
MRLLCITPVFTILLCGAQLRSVESLHSSKSRRRFFVNTLAWLSPGTVAALAADPIKSGEPDNVGALVLRLIRPKPLKLLRSRLNQDFAVLLMRSSYNELDQLDCVAMDQFQRDFFLIRQAEYQPYVNSLGPGVVSQGDLADPYYFDFISLAQYLTINRDISNDPPFVFSEQQPVEVPEGELQRFESVIVKRDPSITNGMLPVLHDKRVGLAVLGRLDEVFGQTDSSLPKIPLGSRPNVGM